MNTTRVTSRIDHSCMTTRQQPGVITSAEEVLALANDHAHHEFHRYHWLSVRFLPYHTGISRLMEALSAESQQRIQALTAKSASLSIRVPVLHDPATKAWQPPPLQRTHSMQQAHFFIIDGEEAALEFSLALLEEWRSRRFYERLQFCNGIPGLDALLNSCIGQSQAQFQVLREAEVLLPTRACQPR